MSEYLKPQSPLYHKTEDVYFYPLTTVDQVMLENGERLNSKIDKCVVVDIENVNIGEPNPVNADTLGGKQASEYATNDYVNQQVIKTAPRNLLDNSDFRNPVNQRGKTVYSNEYCIDRWKADNARSGFEIAENGVYFCNNGSTEGNTYLQQHLEDYKIVNGKYYTIAACIDGVIYSKSGVANGENTGVYIETPKGSIGFLYSPGYKVFAARYTTYSTTKTLLEWMALYEGEYTAETLPEYQPKGYGAELAECQRYYLNLQTASQWSVIHNVKAGYLMLILPIPSTFRTTPSIVANPNGTQIYTNGWQPFDITLIGVMEFPGYIVLHDKTSNHTELTFTEGMSYLMNHLPSLAADL